MTTLPSLSRLRAQLPPDRVSTAPAALAVHDADAQTAYRQRALAVVTPATTDELIQVVRWCHQERVPFVVRGSGTGLCAGATPVEGGIAIVTTRLNRICELDPVRRLAVVEPGVVNLDITRAATPHGLFYAPDPSSQPVCTIGGNVGFNAGGAHCLKHGMTANHVLGLRAVLANGEVHDWCTDSRETLGPGWSGLFIGNEGLFGVALEITVNLLPRPASCFTVLAGFTSSEHAGDTVSAIIAAGIVPVAMELMDALTIEAVRPVVAIDYPPNCQALLVIELDGPTAIVATDQIRLEQLLRTQRATGWVVARDASSRAAIWKVRKSAYSAYGRLAPSNMVQDCVVPRRHLGTALRRIDELSSAAGLRCANICHAGDGNIHPNLLHDANEPGAHARVEALAGQILETCIALGGSITGEHGVGIEKRPYLAQMYGPAEVDLFHRLRAAYDPLFLANPGKMLPPPVDHPAPTFCPSPAARLTELPPPTTIDELIELIRRTPHCLPVGQRTKPALSAHADTPLLSLRALRGITEYVPEEFVLTALAGTPLSEIAATLAAQGQALAFDAPLASAGATLGGTVATALSGPGRFRHGSVRDAVIGLTAIDGRGQRLQLGSRVVKNVAGFDLPKFLCGSLGRYAVLAEITLKVVPRRDTTTTFRLPAPLTDERTLLARLAALARTAQEAEAIEVRPAHGEIWVRFSAPAAAAGDRITDLRTEFPTAQLVPLDEAAAFWTACNDFSWAPTTFALLKVPSSLASLPRLLPLIAPATTTACWHVSAAGDVAYAAVAPAALAAHRAALTAAGFGSLLLRGEGPPLVGATPPGALAQRVKTVLDPFTRFPAPLA